MDSDIAFEKTKIMARQIILGFLDINLAFFSTFDSRKIYKKPLNKYYNFRIDDRKKYQTELYRLKQKKFIKKYYQDKTEYIELTKKGKLLLRKYITDQLEFKYPNKWDKKWRIVIFDIPNQKRKRRDIVRHKLLRIGFIELQESVYVFPFDCLKEIKTIRATFQIKDNVQIILADRIETEINLIKRFLDHGILSEKQINKLR